MPSQKELDIKIIRSCYEGNFHVLESEILAFLKEKEFTIERFERLRENIWSLRISKEFGDLLVDLDLPILVDRNLKPGKGEICLYGLTVLKGGQEISFEQLSGNQIEVLKDHLSIFIPPISQNENETLEDLFNSLYNNSQKKNPLTIRPYWQDTYKKFKIKKNFKPKLDGIDQEVREFIHDYGFPIIFSNFGVIYLMESLFKDLNNNKPVQKLFIREYIELKKIYHANKVMWLLINHKNHLYTPVGQSFKEAILFLMIDFQEFYGKQKLVDLGQNKKFVIEAIKGMLGFLENSEVSENLGTNYRKYSAPDVFLFAPKNEEYLKEIICDQPTLNDTPFLLYDNAFDNSIFDSLKDKPEEEYSEKENDLALKIAQKVVSSFRALDFWEGSFSYQFFPLEKMENVQELLKRENIEWSNFLIESRNLKEDMIVNLSDRLEVLQENF